MGKAWMTSLNPQVSSNVAGKSVIQFDSVRWFSQHCSGIFQRFLRTPGGVLRAYFTTNKPFVMGSLWVAQQPVLGLDFFWSYPHMAVSIIGGSPKWTVYHGNILVRWMIWGYPHLRKPPYIFVNPNVLLFIWSHVPLTFLGRRIWTHWFKGGFWREIFGLFCQRSMGISGSNWWRYVSTVFLAIFSGDIFSYIGLIWNRYLLFQSVPEDLPHCQLEVSCVCFFLHPIQRFCNPWNSWKCACVKILCQWIGLRENLQETRVFTIKYRAFL